MLLVSKKYESIDKIVAKSVNEDEVVDEEITDKGFTKLKKAVKDDPRAELLTDKEVNDYKDAIVKYGFKKSLADYDEFFISHGIDGKDLKKLIFDAFIEGEEGDKLREILENDGIITVDDLKSGSNMYKLCDGFDNAAREIAVYEGMAAGKAVGKFEVLLRMILKGGNGPSVGDVGIGSEVLEVKICTSKTGAHPSYQGMKGERMIFAKIDAALGLADSSIVNYSNEKGIVLFNERMKTFLSNKKNKVDTIIRAITDGINEQYAAHAQGGVDAKTIISEYKDKLKSGSMTSKEFREMIGRAQILMYTSAYDYFTIINVQSGNYLFMDKTNVIEKSREITYSPFSITDSSRPGVTIQYKK